MISQIITEFGFSVAAIKLRTVIRATVNDWQCGPAFFKCSFPVAARALEYLRTAIL
jgi:hypothetical protein